MTIKQKKIPNESWLKGINCLNFLYFKNHATAKNNVNELMQETEGLQ